MRYAGVEVDGAIRWGRVHDERIQLLDGGPYGQTPRAATECSVHDVRLLAPVTPSKIYCLGRNYADHRTEMGYGHDGSPSVFMKGSTTGLVEGGRLITGVVDHVLDDTATRTRDIGGTLTTDEFTATVVAEINRLSA